MVFQIKGNEIVENWQLDAVTNVPELVIIVFGDNPASATYVKKKEEKCMQYHIKCTTHHIPDSMFAYHFAQEIIEKANKSNNVKGIMIQLPICESIDYEQQRELINMIDPNKDVDGLTDIQMGRLQNVRAVVPSDTFVPATARAIYRMLISYADHTLGDVNRTIYKGLNAVVIGRSNLVGKPVATILSQVLNMNVTILHSQSEPELVAEHLKNAKVVVSAIGQPLYIWADYIRDDAIVIDAGTSYIEVDRKKKLVGDIRYAGEEERFMAYSTVPNGVGPVTVHALIANIIDSTNHAGEYLL